MGSSSSGEGGNAKEQWTKQLILVIILPIISNVDGKSLFLVACLSTKW